MEEALKAFGEEGFDVKAWVNAQVRASEALAESAGHAKGANVDDNLSTLVVKLQLMAQSASKAVDEHAQKLVMELRDTYQVAAPCPCEAARRSHGELAPPPCCTAAGSRP